MKFKYFWLFEYHLQAQDAWASSDFRTHVDIITLNGIPNRLSLWIKKYMCARRDGGRSEGYHSCRLEIDADALPSTITKLQPISVNSWYETATLFISFLTCVWFLVDRFCFLQENEFLKLVVLLRNAIPGNLVWMILFIRHWKIVMIPQKQNEIADLAFHSQVVCQDCRCNQHG